MGGRYIGVLEDVPVHKCEIPQEEVVLNTVWRCDCGREYRLEEDTTDYGHDWQPGDTRRRTWKIFKRPL